MSFFLLNVAFPVWERLEYFKSSQRYIFGAYFLMSLIVTVINLLLVPALTYWAGKWQIWASVTIRVLGAFTLLVVMAWYLGPSGSPLGDIPLISGPFFSEWLFLSFIIQVATTLPLLAAVYYWWIAKYGRYATAHTARIQQ